MGFVDDMRQYKHGERGFKILIQLWDDDASTYISVSFVDSPTWQVVHGISANPILKTCSDVTYEMQFGASFVSIPDINFTVHNARINENRSGEDRLSDIFCNGDIKWYAAPCQLSLLAETTPGSYTSMQIWQGYLTDMHYDDETVYFSAMALRDLIRNIPDDIILATDYPEAPESSIAGCLPLVFGQHSDSYYHQSSGHYLKSDYIGTHKPVHVVPAICTDTNAGDDTTGPVFHVAGHECDELPYSSSVYNGVYFYVDELDQMAVFDSGTYTISNTSAGAKITFDKDYKFACHIDPLEVGSANTATNAMRAGDKDEETYATMPGGAGQILSLTIQRPPDLGGIDWAKVYIIQSNTSLSGVVFGLHDGSSYWGGSSSLTSTGTNYEVHTLSGVTLNHVDDFPAALELRVSGGTSTSLLIYEICLVVQYKPYRQVQISQWRQGASPRFIEDKSGRKTQRGWYQTVEAEGFPDITEQTHRVFVHVIGVKDDVSGTYTGTPSQELRYPSEVIHYILDNEFSYEVLTSGIASFVRARTACQYYTTLSLIDKTPTRKVIGELAKQGAFGLTIKPSNMKFGVVYWGDHAQHSYGSAIPWNAVYDWEMDWTPAGDVRNHIYIQGNYSHRQRKCTNLAYGGPYKSDDGEGTNDWSAAQKQKMIDSESYYGEKRELHITANYLKQWNLDDLRDKMANMLYWQRVRLTLLLDWGYADLFPGTVILPDDTSWRDAGVLYPGATDGYDGYWEHGSVTREFWVERVTFMANGHLEIEATAVEAVPDV